MKTLIPKDTHTPVFMAALFTVNQDMEAIQMATDRWMEKEDMVYVYVI